MRSIRQFLVANLLIGVLFATNLAILSNLYFGYQSLRPQLDAQMVITANGISAFLQEDNDIGDLQSRLAYYHPSVEQTTSTNTHYLQALHRSLDSIQFRIYSPLGKALAESVKAPKTTVHTIPTGFSSINVDNEQWRTFKLTTQTGNAVIVYHPHVARLHLEENANTKAILVILLTIPPLGIFLWIIISRSLVSIHSISEAIKRRAHNNLSPIPTQDIPKEIYPLIIEINSLFDRLHQNFLRESRFAADAAHELKTPLAALKTHIQVAQSAKTIQETHQQLDKVISCVDRAAQTVDQLLMLSRTMPDAHMREYALVDIATAIAPILAELSPFAQQRKIEVAFQNHSSQSSLIFGHEIALQTLVANLIDNAIRYSPTQTTVTVTLDQDNDHYILSVQDQGPGIPESLRNRVFERFYRVLGTSQTGSGLGLNIVKQIVELHQGIIELENLSGAAGLCVRILLPRPADIHVQINQSGK